jgi:ribosomal protein S18 acetylase RimI-like enzyme
LALTVEPARPDDAGDVSRLLRDYLTSTEQEKAERGLAAEGPLPRQYQDEIDRPEKLLSTCLLARLDDGQAAGLVVLQSQDEAVEIKRLWVDPGCRGTGAGRALVRAALERAGAQQVTLTVWDWRSAPIALYRSFGFTDSRGWDQREHLLCMTFQGG